MMLNIAREKRHTVNRIVVDQVEILKKINNKSFNRSNIKLYNDQSTESTKQIARNFLYEYLYDSSLHGVKYFGNLRIKSTILGKLFWALIMNCSFVFLTWMLWKTWIRYSTNPTRTVIQSFHSSVATVPFPAITVCPLVIPLRERREKVMQSLQLPPNMDNKTAMFLLKYGTEFVNERVPGKKYIYDLKELLHINNITMINFLKLLRPCEDLFEFCWWDGAKKNCNELFTLSYTYTGLCCSFNYLLENDTQTGRTTKDSDLLRTMLFGPRAGLIATVKRNLIADDDNKTDHKLKFSTNSAGLLIYTHHPLEYVGAIATRQILQANREMRLAVVPSSKQKIAGYYYRNSRGELIPQCADKTTKLKYFSTNRYSNCFTSCSIEAVQQICNCLPYYYTPIAVKYSLKICDWQDFKCLYANTENIQIIHNIVEENFTCECQNPCWNVYYEIRSSSLLLNGAQDFNISPIYQNLTYSQAILRVYFASDIFEQTNTIPVADELYLLASMGGIFSLFLGASFISVVEILYFIELFFRSYYKKKKSK